MINPIFSFMLKFYCVRGFSRRGYMNAVRTFRLGNARFVHCFTIWRTGGHDPLVLDQARSILISYISRSLIYFETTFYLVASESYFSASATTSYILEDDYEQAFEVEMRKRDPNLMTFLPTRLPYGMLLFPSIESQKVCWSARYSRPSTTTHCTCMRSSRIFSCLFWREKLYMLSVFVYFFPCVFASSERCDAIAVEPLFAASRLQRRIDRGCE